MRPHGRQPTRLPHPWGSPGKNTGVGCHFLLQCRKVKSESEVAQLCPTLSDPMHCSLPGSSVHGIFQARVLEWGAIAFSVCGVYMPTSPPSPRHPCICSLSVSLFLLWDRLIYAVSPGPHGCVLYAISAFLALTHFTLHDSLGAPTSLRAATFRPL